MPIANDHRIQSTALMIQSSKLLTFHNLQSSANIIDFIHPAVTQNPSPKGPSPELIQTLIMVDYRH